MMDQQLLKNHTIGYNTVSSVDGIINARGVKSKPNNIEIMGYTHEVGEGEKSPDNPYQLVSLDSGATDLAKSMTTINLFIDDNGYLMNHPYNVTIYIACSPNTSYIINRTKYQATIQKNIACSSGVPKNGLKVSNSVPFPKGDTSIMYTTTSNASYLIFQVYLTSTYVNDYNNNILYKGLSIYEQNGHSIKITNNDKTIQVPTPIALNCVEGVSDRIVKKEDGYYVEQNIQDIIVDKINDIREQKNGYIKFNIDVENGKVINTNKIICDKLLVKGIWQDSFTLEYIRSSTNLYPDLLVAYMLTSRFTTNSTATKDEVSAYLKDNPLTVLYQVENPYYLRLSDYAQQLLNSFELQNQNEISVEGLPEIKISGYIQN